MILETPFASYRWHENWIKIPESALGKANGRTHGLAVAKDGRIFIFHQASPAMIVCDPSGKIIETWGDYPGAHAITLVEEDGQEYLWLVDHISGAVEKTTLGGKLVQKIGRPDHAAYAQGKYSPTWVTVNEMRHGGSGDIWVADGYGSSLVHCYDRHGAYLLSIDGESGAGRFKCPHGIAFDQRNTQPTLLVADRGNTRIQIYDAKGVYQTVIGADFLNSPDCFAFDADRLVVPELFGRVTILDRANNLLGYLGENCCVNKVVGWPNENNIENGKFSSPHGATVDRYGNIFVVEWRTGGRVIKLERL